MALVRTSAPGWHGKTCGRSPSGRIASTRRERSMEQVRSIVNDSVVRATDRCDMSCDVDGDELRFEFEHGKDNGLQLAFDWPGFVRFMRLASTVMERLRAIPAGTPI